MSSEDPAHGGGINHAEEWKLIYGLRESSHCFSRPEAAVVRGGSTRTQELRNAVHYLDVQIRTFTILQLDLLLYLESEIEDDASQTSSESEIEEDSGSAISDPDDDDASSRSSLGSLPDERLDLLGHSSSPSASEALFYLRELCSALESRVNPFVIPVEPGDGDQPGCYPRLTRLIKRLRCLSPSLTGLHFIPNARSTPSRFLFNISEDTPTADAFAAFTDPEQRRPHREIRQRMLKEAKCLGHYFFSLNSFVDKLQFSVASLDNLAMQPSGDSTSNESSVPFALLQNFRQQTAVAYRAILSQVRCCDLSEHTEHKILLRLPGWEDISRRDSPDTTENPAVHLFFTVSPLSDWQLAKMYFLPPEHTKAYRQRKLCKALSSSHDGYRDLEFYVSEECRSSSHVEIPIHVPNLPKGGRIYRDSCPDDRRSLWTLIKRGHFAKEPNLQLASSTGCKGTIIGMDQRKALAIRLILGLMISMDSDHDFESWDPKHIHFLKPQDAQNTPFVSIPGKVDSSSRRNRLLLPRLFPCSGLDEDDDDLKPLPQFVLLAKVLLQISHGDRLDGFKISREPQRGIRHTWQRLRDTIEWYTQRATCGPQVDREILPFLRAALGCLDFHMEYQSHLREAQPSERIGLAWKLVFDTILVKIDGNLTLKGVVKSSTNALIKDDPSPVACHPVVQDTSVIASATSISTSSCTTVIEETANVKLPIRCVSVATAQPSQPDVVLFDTGRAAKASTADEFWKLLDKFHASYSRFVTERITDTSGLESPRRIRIAVLDTGIDFNHSGIMEAKGKGRIKQEWCHSWIGADANDDDNELHGTNCAYLLHKVAPEADIYVEKVFKQNALRFYEAENIAKAIKHAANTWNVDIISMSFGLRRPAARDDGNKEEERLALERYREIIDDIENAMRDASGNPPRILFAAASNSGKNEPRAFPANYHPWVICVHASEGNGEEGGINPEMEQGFNFMTLGMGLELMERESFVKGGRQFSKYKKVTKSGTSFATPIAAGIAATVLDLAARVQAVNSRAKQKLRRREEMEKILRIMSIPKNGARDRLHYMAPWHHWESGWETEEHGYRWVWDTINKLF